LAQLPLTKGSKAIISRKNMNRIIPILAITVAGFVGLANAAQAGTPANSTSSGTVAPTCSVTALPGTLTPTTNIINGGNFPTELTSNANPGKFTTLCNTATSTIKVQRLSSVSYPGDQGGVITYSYSLSATGTSAYVGNTILANGITGTTIKTGSISHAFSTTPSDLIVSVKANVANGYILGEGDYGVSIKATLTP
jgi:hypothetical protein